MAGLATTEERCVHDGTGCEGAYSITATENLAHIIISEGIRSKQ